jgi:hypothetical protein
MVTQWQPQLNASLQGFVQGDIFFKDILSPQNHILSYLTESDSVHNHGYPRNRLQRPNRRIRAGDPADSGCRYAEYAI